MVLNCGCIDMAELNKTIHIRKGSTEQTVKLYTTQAEAGEAYSYIKVDGVQAYIPLGAENDSRATIGRVKEHTGSQFAILTSGKPPYHKDSYTNAGTYTWTCPAGVTKARVTVAGGGGGSSARHIAFGNINILAKGGSGDLIIQMIDVTPHTSYNIIVGNGGESTVSNNSYGSKAKDGQASSFASISARGGGGAFSGDNNNSSYDGTSYGSGAAGSSAKGVKGNTGWVYIEYGGDI